MRLILISILITFYFHSLVSQELFYNIEKYDFVQEDFTTLEFSSAYKDRALFVHGTQAAYIIDNKSIEQIFSAYPEFDQYGNEFEGSISASSSYYLFEGNYYFVRNDFVRDYGTACFPSDIFANFEYSEIEVYGYCFFYYPIVPGLSANQKINCEGILESNQDPLFSLNQVQKSISIPGKHNVLIVNRDPEGFQYENDRVYYVNNELNSIEEKCIDIRIQNMKYNIDADEYIVVTRDGKLQVYENELNNVNLKLELAIQNFNNTENIEILYGGGSVSLVIDGVLNTINQENQIIEPVTSLADRVLQNVDQAGNILLFSDSENLIAYDLADNNEQIIVEAANVLDIKSGYDRFYVALSQGQEEILEIQFLESQCTEELQIDEDHCIGDIVNIFGTNYTESIETELLLEGHMGCDTLAMIKLDFLDCEQMYTLKSSDDCSQELVLTNTNSLNSVTIEEHPIDYGTLSHLDYPINTDTVLSTVKTYFPPFDEQMIIDNSKLTVIQPFNLIVEPESQSSFSDLIETNENIKFKIHNRLIRNNCVDNYGTDIFNGPSTSYLFDFADQSMINLNDRTEKINLHVEPNGPRILYLFFDKVDESKVDTLFIDRGYVFDDNNEVSSFHRYIIRHYDGTEITIETEEDLSDYIFENDLSCDLDFNYSNSISMVSLDIFITHVIIVNKNDLKGFAKTFYTTEQEPGDGYYRIASDGKISISYKNNHFEQEASFSESQVMSSGTDLHTCFYDIDLVGTDVYVLSSHYGLFPNSCNEPKKINFDDPNWTLQGTSWETGQPNEICKNIRILGNNNSINFLGNNASFNQIEILNESVLDIFDAKFKSDNNGHIWILSHLNAVEIGDFDARSLKVIVYDDINGNCIQDANEENLEGVEVQIGFTTLKITNNEGEIDVILEPGAYRINAELRSDLYSLCQNDVEIIISEEDSDNVHKIGVQAIESCVDLRIGSTIPFLRRCFDQDYFIEVYNDGSVEAEDVSVIITLDEYFNYNSSSFELLEQTGNEIRLHVGNIPARSEIRGSINFNLSCDAELGANHYMTSFVEFENPCGELIQNSESFQCIENIGSYDPNDKAIFLNGFSNRQVISKEDKIDYLIRFQNTGTDTAFTVRIEDELEPYFDLSTIEPVSASHDYDWSLEMNRLIVTFDDILLVDSFKNEPESHGFLKFNIGLYEDFAAPGSVIENTAQIYFDFNEAIITNTVESYYLCQDVEHTLDVSICSNEEYEGYSETGNYTDQFVTELGCDSTRVLNLTVIDESVEDCINTNTEELKLNKLKVYPNPVDEYLKIEYEGHHEVKYNISDISGRIILQGTTYSGDQIDTKGIVSGLYLINIKTSGKEEVQKFVVAR